MTTEAPKQTPDAALKLAPHPKGVPVLGHLFRVADKRRFDWFKTLHDTYGDVVNISALSRDMYLINHPDMVKYVMQMNNRNYHKGNMYSKLKVVLGEGLFTSEGDFWRRQRRLAQPIFHRQKISRFGQDMVAATEEMMASWRPYVALGEAFDVADSMMRLTLSIVTKAMFSTLLSDEEIDIVAQVFPPILRETNRRIRWPIPLREKLPTSTNRAYEKNLAYLNNIIMDIIRRRRASGEELPDLLGMLMAAEDEETGERMSDKQLRDEIMTIFLAGHETTATALSWAWVILSRQTAVRQTLQAELDAVLQGRPPTAADFKQLPYTLMVFKEVMRLYPPLPAFARTPLADDQIGGYHIPAHSEVIIVPYLLHRHPGYWENPEGFDPYRFTPEKEKAHHKFMYLPFGGGPRLCIGNNFALLEAVLILATIMQNYTLDLIPTRHIAPEITLNIRPKGGVWVTVHPRTGASGDGAEDL